MINFAAPARNLLPTFLVDGQTTTDRLLRLHQLCREHEITLPFILKPDVGQRGSGVKLIRSMLTALEYLQTVDAPVQRYVPGPQTRRVFSITASRMNRVDTFSRSQRKIFPTITGDGIRSVEELIGAMNAERDGVRTHFGDLHLAEVMFWRRTRFRP